MIYQKYLSEKHLKGFDSYKYSSIDTSPVAVYISHPFWNQVVKIYPTWLAPNVLTFSGMILVMTGFALLTLYDYYFYAASDAHEQNPPVPNILWLILALFTFLAHVMDGTDGKQARRTSSSGPTGELFDHGIDSWLTIPFILSFYSIFGRVDYSVNEYQLMLILMLVQLCFIVSHWEKYITGVLFLSWGYDIGQYFLSIFYLITWCLGGHDYWKFKIDLAFGISTSPAQLAMCTFWFGALAISIPMSVYNIVESYQNKTGRMLDCYEASVPMFSTLALFTAACLWAVYSPYRILHKDPRAFMWLFGTIFSNIACRLIVSQMTHTRSEPFNMLLWPYLALAAVSVCLPGFLGPWELVLVRVLAVVVSLAHIHYGACVVLQMCEHFDINCFSIKRAVKK